MIPILFQFFKTFFIYFPIYGIKMITMIVKSNEYKTFALFHVSILQTYALLVTFNGFPVFEIRKNLDLRKVLLTPKIFLKSRFHCISTFHKHTVYLAKAYQNLSMFHYDVGHAWQKHFFSKIFLCKLNNDSQ